MVPHAQMSDLQSSHSCSRRWQYNMIPTNNPMKSITETPQIQDELDIVEQTQRLIVDLDDAHRRWSQAT
jgi:hypothetical protein